MIQFIVLAVLYKWVLCGAATIHGRYTKSIKDYHLSIPHKLTPDGEFSTFYLPHYHDHKMERYKDRQKRTADDPEMIHYGILINDDLHHLELWPNRQFLHPGLVAESRDPEVDIKKRQVRTLKNKRLCHYTGRVKDMPESRAALSTCDGLAGYIVINNKKYYIEPVDEHSPNSKGHHLHVVYDRAPNDNRHFCGTNTSWEEAIKNRFREELKKGKDIFKEKRTAPTSDRYLEVGVICDKKFMLHHKGKDVELYVMTIMNMVSDYYHDSSVGHQIDVVIVRIIYLEKEEEEIDLEINKDAGKTLRSFCDWAIKINNPEDSSNHYDMALLLTRYDLCGDGEKDCDLTGLAYVGGACSEREQCGINEDGGLVLSVIVAHEIGHLMGSDHDGQETSCSVQDSDGSYFVMSPTVSTYTLRWSSCSRNMITALLDNNLGQCLSDIPDFNLYPFSDNMPGVVYDASEQCKFMLPASTGVCKGLKEKVCEHLVCQINKKECVGKNDIAADGTKCGENKWCFKKKCIEMGARPEAINGGWGDWGSWTDCTRTCGGGVSYSERDCNNPVPANKGRFCQGERRKIKICNPTPCLDDSPTFRQQQCSEQDPKPWNNQFHTWTSSFDESKPCALYCVNEENVLSMLEAVVKDGTPCKLGTRNMCISGVCRLVGCDSVLDSEAVEDLCGVCNGDGTQCRIIEATYKDIGNGYTKVVVIPAGSKNVKVEEMAPSINIIAISDSTEKKFYLNGDSTESEDGEYKIGKNIGVYTHIEPRRERFVMRGPVKEDIVLFIAFFEQENPGYTYSWAEPSIDSTYEPHYHWEIGEYGDCSLICGGGTQIATINCMEEKAGKVSSNFCSGLDQPKAVTKNCNEQPCKKKWKVGAWGQCRACKNKGGVRARPVECVQETSKKGADDIILEDSECEGQKPGSVELCETAELCARKRMISYIPRQYQKSIWAQMNKIFSWKKRNARNITQAKDGINGESKHIGQMVHDFKPLDEQVVIKYTVKPNPMNTNLSDNANAQVGDALSDVIDLEHKTVFKGKDAAKLKHVLQNTSNGTLKFSCHKKDGKN
ncbi:unnamed protein product [Ceutorhynchus assimilis]|uniref:ADAM cysteine-rich domain-containing protein n=1 Tax=Ceutorhynchus assimilis TaxID=467358 RepID=A0A9N9QJ12_9CUCU|nr:unnamed protein product [Ceutorhynchus assimilis]